MFGNMMSNLGTGLLDAGANTLDAGVDAFSNVADMGKEIMTQPIDFAREQMNIDDLLALAMNPEDYEEYKRQKFMAAGDVSSRPPTLVPPAQPPQFIPPTQQPSFVNQFPNYLNDAQRAIGGPYG
jgi:hypothetical protein